MKLREFEGTGALQIDVETYPIEYSLQVHEMQGLSASGDLTGPLALLMMGQHAKSCYLILAGGEHKLKIVITRHSHGHPAGFKVDGDIPVALRP